LAGAYNRDNQDQFANIVNDRLDEMAQADIKRLLGDGERWCLADEQREGATKEILVHSGHADANGNLTAASKQRLAAIKKSRDDVQKKYDAQQRKTYQDTARESSALEREILLRLHTPEKRGLIPDEATTGVFMRLANGTYSCEDFRTARSYLYRLEQQFASVNSIKQ
jgi:hypothetical protein